MKSSTVDLRVGLPDAEPDGAGEAVGPVAVPDHDLVPEPDAVTDADMVHPEADGEADCVGDTLIDAEADDVPKGGGGGKLRARTRNPTGDTKPRT